VKRQCCSAGFVPDGWETEQIRAYVEELLKDKGYGRNSPMMGGFGQLLNNPSSGVETFVWRKAREIGGGEKSWLSITIKKVILHYRSLHRR